MSICPVILVIRLFRKSQIFADPLSKPTVLMHWRQHGTGEVGKVKSMSWWWVVGVIPREWFLTKGTNLRRPLEMTLSSTIHRTIQNDHKCCTTTHVQRTRQGEQCSSLTLFLPRLNLASQIFTTLYTGALSPNVASISSWIALPDILLRNRYFITARFSNLSKFTIFYAIANIVC